jgi:hypothetical protein
MGFDFKICGTSYHNNNDVFGLYFLFYINFIFAAIATGTGIGLWNNRKHYFGIMTT